MNNNEQGIGFRTLPHNIEAERGLIGAILIDNMSHEKVAEYLRPEHFVTGQHQMIFGACVKLIEGGQIAGPITLKPWFEQNGSLAEIGGTGYLGELAANAVTVINAGEYGRIIYDLHLKRELIAIGQDIIEDAYAGEVDEIATAQIEDAEKKLYDLASTGLYEGGFQSFRKSLLKSIEMAEIAHNRDSALSGITTGLRDMDDLLGGLHDSDLLILAARPSMGKTALATNIAFNAAKAYVDSNGDEGAVVGFFSLEMSAEQLSTRILSDQTEVSSSKIRKGHLTGDQLVRLSGSAQTLHNLPIFIDDTPALTISALRTRARRLKRQNNLGFIIVDYLQLLQGSKNSKSDGRVQEVSEISRGLKTIAKELEVPVLALSQLSRQVENRDDKRPQLSDLRESGSLEQDADIVMFIYREEYYLEKLKPKESQPKFVDKIMQWEVRMEKCKNMADIIVGKQRHGPIGTIHLVFRGEFTKFSDLARNEQWKMEY